MIVKKINLVDVNLADRGRKVETIHIEMKVVAKVVVKGSPVDKFEQREIDAVEGYEM